MQIEGSPFPANKCEFLHKVFFVARKVVSYRQQRRAFVKLWCFIRILAASRVISPLTGVITGQLPIYSSAIYFRAPCPSI